MEDAMPQTKAKPMPPQLADDEQVMLLLLDDPDLMRPYADAVVVKIGCDATTEQKRALARRAIQSDERARFDWAEQADEPTDGFLDITARYCALVPLFGYIRDEPVHHQLRRERAAQLVQDVVGDRARADVPLADRAKEAISELSVRGLIPLMP
jgi:hypothetical protein